MKNAQQQLTAAYGEHSASLLRFCLRKISNYETAKDLLQETFFRALRHLNQGKSIKNQKAFLYKILGNLIIDQYRKRPEDESLDTLREDGFDPGSDDEAEHLINTLDGKQVIKFLEKVREPYQKTIKMRYVQELSIREIAGISHTQENTVVVRIHRGLRILKRLLEHVPETKHGHIYHPA